MATRGEVFQDPQSAETFPRFVRAAAAAYGSAPAITLQRSGLPDETLSFAQIEMQSATLARALVARGVGKGTRVGFIHGNGPAFAVTLAAIARIGAIAIPVSTVSRANELVRILRQSDVAGLIVQRTLLGKNYVDRLCEAVPALRETATTQLRLTELPYLRWIVSTGADLPASVQPMEQLLAEADSVSEELLQAVEAEVHVSDQMIEVYTSGSMALPKGVKHNHGPILFRTHYICSKLAVSRGTSTIAAIPMFWIGGLMMTLMPNWAVGATTICTEGTSPNSRFAQGSVLADEDLKLRANASIHWALGMTETLGPYAWGNELRAVGYPLCPPLDHIADRYEIRIAVDGKPVPEGITGEIQLRGYAVTPGLHKIERSEHFEPDGFYCTGDLGVVEGNRIHFVGRDADMIKTTRSNVSPAEVEMEMLRLEGVHSAYVLGLPDEERGQIVVAAVVPREGAELDFAAIERALKANLSSFKVPRAFVAIGRNEVPMLISNKVAKRELAAMVAARLGRSKDGG